MRDTDVPRSRFLAGLLAVVLALPVTAVATAVPAAAATPGPGDVVVVRVGDGSAALSSAAAPVFLDEYAPDGSVVRSTPLPVAAAGANKPLTVSGTATSEGALALSSDGRYLTLAGYGAAPGTAAVGSTTAAATPRVVARIDSAATVDSSTALSDAASGSSMRSAASVDGSSFYTAGGAGGARYATLGATTSTQLAAAPTNVRTVAVVGGQLYLSSGSSPFTGVSTVGAGTPTTAGQTAALVASAPSAYAFTLLDRSPTVPGADTLYVADDSASPNGGVLKYSFDGTAWTARGSFRPGGGAARGLTGAVAADGTVGLLATTTTGTGQFVRVTDTAAFDAPIAATSTTLATAAANTALRGVAFAPQGTVAPPVAPEITTQPQDATITPGATATLTVAAGGNPTYQWYQGLSGDTSTPVAGATGASFTTPPLNAGTSYWVRATNAAGTADSRTAAVTVAAAPPACSTTPVTIGSVEGTGDVSPLAGQNATVRGTVVGDYEGPQPALRGFYLQDAGDGDPATSDAVFVFDNGANLVANGDVVEVTGPVSEFQGQTQISPATGGVTSCGTTATVTPVDVTLPRASATDLEPYEGMLVRLHQTATVTEEFQLGRFGQVVVSSGGKLRQPTSDIRATDKAAVTALQNANNLNRLIIDDADQAQNPDPIVFGRGGQPLSATNTLRGGDTVTDAVGVLTYTWAGNAASGNAYRLRPVGALGGAATFDPANPRPTAPPAVGNGGIKVASANLLNFFNTYTGCTFGVGGAAADCRGPNNDAEYQRQLAKEVDSLTFLGADVIGFMEMENNGYGPGSAEQALVDALNAKSGAGTWAFINPDAATGITNSAGTDAIKPGLLYKPASVTPVAGKTFADQAAGVFERNPVAQTFTTPAGATFTVIANHFKSKGSCPTSGPDTDQGDGQSCWNARRTAQATELANWITNTVVPAAGDPDVMIVGDLNSYAGEDPIAVLENAGYVSTIKQFGGDQPYSYVFDGQWGYLDYVMASASLIPQVTGAGDAHHNADEPSVLDYNTEFKTAGQVTSLYAPDRFRTSDHDPVLAGIALGAPATIAGTPPSGTVGAAYSFAFTTGGTGPVTVAVVDGALPPGLTLAPDGTVSGTPTAGGSFAFTVRATGPSGSTDLATSITIGTATSTTTLTGTTPVATGATVTLTATVTAAVAPTGTVVFSLNGQPLATVPVAANGTAVFTTTAPGPGSYPIVATYGGTTTLAGSASAPVTVEVLDPVQVGGTFPNGTVGQAYAATAQNAGTSPTFSITKGTVPPGLTLSGDGTLRGIPTTSGTFSFEVTATNAVSKASARYTVAIAAGATTVAITSSRNPSATRTAVTFTATVVGARPSPGGTVTFRAGSVAIGAPAAVVNGTASRSTGTLPLGTTTITATYSGSRDYLGSAGTLDQVVVANATFTGTPPAGTVGTAYSYAFAGTGGATFTVTAGALPAGLALSPAGVLFGTPTARGLSSFTVRAANAVSAQERSFTVRIR